MGLQYHPITAADIALVTDLRIALLSEIHGTQATEAVNLLTKNLHEYFKGALEAKTYVGWLAKDGAAVVGCSGMVVREQPGNFKNPGGEVGYILNMYVVPLYRAQGIGNNLLKYLLDTANEMGIHAFELHATPEGEPLYKKWGFSLHPVPTYRKATL